MYCAPAAINKGIAVNRLMEQLPSNITVGIGDSENDIPMLEQVDVPILPQSLEHHLSNPKKVVVSPSNILSDVACHELEKLINSNYL